MIENTNGKQMIVNTCGVVKDCKYIPAIDLRSTCYALSLTIVCNASKAFTIIYSALMWIHNQLQLNYSAAKQPFTTLPHVLTTTHNAPTCAHNHLQRFHLYFTYKHLKRSQTRLQSFTTLPNAFTVIYNALKRVYNHLQRSHMYSQLFTTLPDLFYKVPS